MDVEQLQKSWADLALEEEESGGLDAPVQDGEGCSATRYELVGRFLTTRQIKFEQMQQVMASVWKPMMGVRVLQINENLFLFQFPHRKDLQRVIDDGPWSFENNTFVCKEITSQVRPEEAVLDTVDYWVQVHDLPGRHATPDFLKQIANHVGTFIALDQNNFGGNWRSFLRVRVAIKVAEPLRRRMKVRQRDGSFTWIVFSIT
ncbi:PREDICTED: uncharacterized protein LOC109187424 [Ipomoea nil]|uniref:uncharacterized protein LOC109187424 n=1 Tax=Ipomoea nil TaxID=35883 RepID=UPI000901DB4F|nr:PREDICTED: uncharacterized protein LOC109187424 [Ipomoea nil]